MRISARLALLPFLLVFAAPVRAQAANGAVLVDSTRSAVALGADLSRLAADSAGPAVVAAAPQAGATIAGVRAGVHARETSRPAHPTAAPAHANLGQARAMMVVGVAGLIVGAIIGGTPGTLIMVGGGVVGLLGLYDYLQ
jgi:hypothetical protein